ncbi:malto-oligosyltrehalose synthase [Propionivibrio soli]|uniref:malto-oligosyltrehalose synthase n=1 Tax=Propionivibrio soli TaxID=2976531 RepID=UPI0021E9939B|nr:malto-oligosyltrehalose synthase [Propionivibrio soli]
MSSAALDALCAHQGIDGVYEDGWGKRTEVTAEAKQALLAALGHALASDNSEMQAAKRLEDLHRADAERVLPPLVVVEAGAAPRLTLRLPADMAGQALPWRLKLEDDGERRGVSKARPLPGGSAGNLAGAATISASASVAAEQGAQGDAGDKRWDVIPMAMVLATQPPMGRHRLTLFAPGSGSRVVAETDLLVCPSMCFDPDEVLEGQRAWGPSVQVYALRSARDWGMGDFGDLRRLVDFAADAGAHFVGVNPLHALFPHDPERASPYSPSNREWLNVLYLDIEAMRDFGECREARDLVGSEAFRERLDALRALVLIDYAGVAHAKFEVLELLYRHFRANHLERGTQRAGLFRDFQREAGRRLRVHALFEALQENFHRLDKAAWGWPAWPEAYRDVNGPAVEAFEQENDERVEFFEYLQWQAEGQLQAVAQRARARGMRIGLYRDMAVGVDPGGSETWAKPALYALSVHVGAPPDELNSAGQDWGFPPPVPQHLVEGGFAAFAAVLRANMRHAGAVRIDHIMGLRRLFWLPANGSGETAATGAYVQYPMETLFQLLCLESSTQRCMVIGEDLGIVPAEVREAMLRHGVLAYRALYFERADEGPAAGTFRPPAEWPSRAMAVIGTHDLPTLRGYWMGHDIGIRQELGIYHDAGEHERRTTRRGEEKAAMLAALADAGVSGEGVRAPEDRGSEPGPRLAAAVYQFVARTPAMLAAVQLEDVLGQLQAVNLPGASDSEYPNWRRKLESELADIAADPRWAAIVQAMNAERVCSPLPVSGGPSGFHPETADIPRATYRLQFHSDFRFADAEAVLPYLAELGISHIYASPFLKARPGSRHGYDIVDHQTVNPEIGSDEDFDRYCTRVRSLGMGQVVDIVPNHVGVLAAENPWWSDVLENGPASEHADHFDIDWEPPFAELRGKVLLPVLGDQYGLVLEAGDLKLEFNAEKGEFGIRYFEHRFPIDPADYPLILGDPMSETPSRVAAVVAGVQMPPMPDDPGLATLLAALRTLPPRTVSEPLQLAERRRNKDVFKKHLAELYARLPAVRGRITARIEAFNGRAGEPESFDAMDVLLERQAYRLASWRVAADDINYRRFFDVNDLAALRIEHEDVFLATHERVFQWLQEGRISGLRIDHPDGLSDPARYFERLQSRYAEIWRARNQGAVEGSPANGGEPPALYVVVEKIVGEFEPLPADWPVHGETGYRFANFSNTLFVDAAQESRFSRVYRAFTGEARDFGEVLLDARELIMTHSLPGEVGILAYRLHEIAQRDRRTRDFTRSRLRSALMEIVAGFPVYRSYIGPRGVSETDRRYIERAVDEAARRELAGDPTVLQFVREVLLSAPAEPDPQLRELKLRFAHRFQQFTAPVMAKAMEDTAFYRYNRLVSLNEVGGDPRTFGTAVEDFHAANERAGCSHPFGLLASSTHDTKRSEDVRARINVLSEMSGAWRLALRRWGRLNAGRKMRVGAEHAPAPNDEYLLYQTMLGVWPMQSTDADLDAETASDLVARLEAYMLKAAREAKQHTSWMNTDAAYENALTTFIRRLLGAGPRRDRFLADFLPFQRLVARFGAFNSLNMLLLKLTVPGVPDIYQGCELWNLSLVDPDNRRPVDFSLARRRFAELRRDFPDANARPEVLRALVGDMEDGRVKLYVLWRALQTRQRFDRPMRFGRYIPLDVSGPAAQHVIAFARADEDGGMVVVIASRLLYGLTEGDPERVADASLWRQTVVSLPWPRAGHSLPTRWRDTLGGRVVAPSRVRNQVGIELSSLFDALPMALLVPDGE